MELLMHILPEIMERRVTEDKFIGFSQVLEGIDLIDSKTEPVLVWMMQFQTQPFAEYFGSDEIWKR